MHVPTCLTSDMVGSTPALLLAVLRPGLGWASGALILHSTYIWVFLLSIVPGPMRVPSEEHQMLCSQKRNPIKVPPSPLPNCLFSSPRGVCHAESLAQGKRQGQAWHRRGMQQDQRASHMLYPHIFPNSHNDSGEKEALGDKVTCPRSNTK